MMRARWFVIGGLAFVVACGTQKRRRHKMNDVGDANIVVVGQKLGLELPPGTQVIGIQTEAGIDDAIFAKLRIPAARTAEFLKQCGVTRFKSGGANLLGPDHGFWDPHQAKRLRSGDVALPSARDLLIAIDESASDALIVYAMNYST